MSVTVCANKADIAAKAVSILIRQALTHTVSERSAKSRNEVATGIKLPLQTQVQLWIRKRQEKWGIPNSVNELESIRENIYHSCRESQPGQPYSKAGRSIKWTRHNSIEKRAALKVILLIEVCYRKVFLFGRYRLPNSVAQSSDQLTWKGVKWSKGIPIHIKTISFNPFDSRSVIMFLSLFNLVCNTSWMPERVFIWLPHIFLKKKAATELKSNNILRTASSLECRMEVTLKDWCENGNSLLKTYTTGKVTAKQATKLYS